MSGGSAMTETASQRYFSWLISKIGVDDTRSHIGLFAILHETEFFWFVPNDDNRVQDALDLRREFGYKSKDGVSVLEVLIALSRRVAFTAGGTPEFWAWQLLKNLRLNRYSDPLSPQKVKRIRGALEDLVYRTYRPDGLGGFFPLLEDHGDQTKTELWYQMNYYVNEIQEP